MMHRRAFLLAAAAPVVCIHGVGADDTLPSSMRKLYAEAKDSVEKGLGFLANAQTYDGAFGDGELAITALSGLAFLSGGHLPDRGKFGVTVERCVRFIVKHTDKDGVLSNPAATLRGPMYSHGFATLLLAEVHGMVRDRALAVQVRDTLAKAVQRIVTTQNDEGGWRYQANPVEQADLSVTSAQLMALRASQQASIPVAKSVMKKGLAFVRRCQVIPEGGFRYMPDNGGMGFPLSAAGLAGLHCCGVYKGDDVTAARSFVCAFQPGKSPPSINADYFLYGHYYAAQAMRQWGGKHWADWYAAIRDELCRPNQSPADRGFTRQANGAWSQPKFGAAYATALACIILQAPLNYLPIFEN